MWRKIALLLVSALLCGVDNAHGYSSACYQCTGSACANIVDTSAACSGATDSCYTIFSDQYEPTSRGCLSALGDDDRASCQNSDNLNCIICSEDNCNSLSRVDHQCLNCTSLENSDCLQDPSSIGSIQCAASVLGDGYCYVRETGTAFERGCVTTSTQLTECSADANCDTCTMTVNGESCNNYQFPLDRIQCWTCAGDTCADQDLPQPYCSDVEDTCVIFNSQGTIKKGCTTTLEETELATCTANSARCLSCTTSLCNLGLPAFAEQRKCFTCSGDECVQARWNSTACLLEADSCYTVFEEYVPVERGCVSALSTEAAAVCTNDTDPSCSICTDDNCNILSRSDHTCLYCNSLEDENCLQDPELISAIQCPASTLDNGYCFVRNVGPVTERGCVTSSTKLTECTDSDDCDTCSMTENGESCNNYEFPYGRNQCWTCTDADCTNKLDVLHYCPRHDERCVTVQSHGSIRKGCESTLDNDEQDVCVQSPDRCEYCSTYQCNLGLTTLPFETTACYHCAGDACTGNALESINCTADGDSCFTIFDQYQPIKRGCVADLNATETASCADANNAECSICAGDNCNTLSRVDHLCLYCNSLEDERCLSDPSSIRSVQCPAMSLSSDKNGYCFVRNVGLVTERGCLTASTKLQECENDANCDICSMDENGESCNNYEYPFNRNKCWTCTDDACTNGEDSLEYCPAHDDGCVSIKDREIKMKGCVGTMSDEATLICSSSPNICQYCTTSQCNLGYSGFPSLPTSCYHCNETNCLSNVLTSAQCAEDADQCFSIFNNYIPIKRGCASTMATNEKIFCSDINNAECSLCPEDNCNNLAQRDHRCLSCSSSNNDACLQHPELIRPILCPVSTIAGGYCYVLDNGAVTERGCALTNASVIQCSLDSNCDICSMGENGEGCNNYEYPFNRMQCWTCEGANCRNNDVLQYCADTQDTCVEYIGNNTLKKGCTKTLTSAEAADCVQTPDNCIGCSGSGCNLGYHTAIPTVRCHSCSTTDDINCSLNPALTATTICAAGCATYLSRRADGKLTTFRSCYANLTDEQKLVCNANGDTDDFICRSCATDNCNTEVIPSAQNRLSCYKYDAQLPTAAVRTDLCEFYDKNDACIIIANKNTNAIIKQACRSSLSLDELNYCNVTTQCRTCTANNCNSRDNVFSCISCNSATNAACATDPSILSGSMCSIYEDSCYTYSAGTDTLRGCTLSLFDTTQALCHNNVSNCALCSSAHNCNSNVFPANRLRCYQCADAAGCRDAQTGTAGICKDYSDLNKCYHITYDNSTTIRKCSMIGDTNTCANSKKCTSCSSSGCNKEKSASQRLQMNSMLLFIIASFAAITYRTS